MRTVLPQKHRLVPANAKRVFKGQIYDVYQWEQELYDGSTAIYEMLKRPDTIQVLAIKDDRLVIVLEEQPSMGPAYYGLPGGRHDDPAETELQAAQRELREETGMEFKTWRLIKAFQPQAKIDQFVYYFVATDFLAQGETHPDPGEKIEVKLVTLDEAKKLAGSPQARHLPDELLREIETLDELKDWPEYQGVPVS